MRLFASDRVKNMMRAMGMEHGESIEHRMVTNAIIKAQRKVEGRNFDMRKHLLEYDDVANDQRQVVYQQRNDLLSDDDISDVITNVRDDVVNSTISAYVPPSSLEEQWDVPGLEQAVKNEFATQLPIQQWLDDDQRFDEEQLRDKVVSEVQANYESSYAHVGVAMREVERQVMLQLVDNLWKDHLTNMDQLRQGIGLRAYAQKNPKQEYKRESFELFEQLLENIKHETIRYLSHVQVSSQDDVARMEQQRKNQALNHQYQHAKLDELNESETETDQNSSDTAKPVLRSAPKVGRNSPCPCGSGKKYKQCCGKI
jgi:preprotein translocase subunit SecA